MNIQMPSPHTTLALLLGASEWPDSPDFHGSKAFSNAMMRFKDYLFDPRYLGLLQENVLDLFDTSDGPHLIDRKIRAFLGHRILEMKQSRNEASDLLVYFVGHGGFVGRDSTYYLAVRCTSTENATVSGIPVEALASSITNKARYLRRIIILDCCYAAAAFTSFQSEGPARLGINQTRNAFEKSAKTIGKGTALLCSSGKNVASQIASDQSCTMFSKALLQALYQGDIRQQTTSYFSPRQIADLTGEILENMFDGKAPQPEVHSPERSMGDVADLPFFPNAAVRAAEGNGINQSTSSPANEAGHVSPQVKPSEPPVTIQIPAISSNTEQIQHRNHRQVEKELLQEAKDHYMARPYDEAQAGYRHILHLNPKSIEAGVQLAYIYSDRQRYDEALRALEQAFPVLPDDLSIRMLHADLLAKLARSQEALDEYGQILNLAPDHIPTMVQQVNLLRRLGRQGEALTACEGILSREPGHLDTQQWKIELLHQQATTYYNRGRELVAWAESHWWLRKKTYRQALAAFDQAIKFDPSFTTAYLERGDLLFLLKRYEKARRDYEQALKLEPESGETYQRLGDVLEILESPTEALEAYSRAIELGMNNVAIWIKTGNALLQQKDYARALVFAERAEEQIAPDSIDHDQRLIPVYQIKIEALKGLGRIDEARELQRDMQSLLDE